MGRSQTPTASTGTQNRRSGPSIRAVISGHVLKIIRESILLTQDRLAEEMGVDLHTVQGWETGRRSLTATSVSSLMLLRQRIRQLGASADLLDALNHAIDADCFLEYVFRTDHRLMHLDDHPLSTWVMKRPFGEMIAWPIIGLKPTAVRSVAPRIRRGPVSDTPVMGSNEKSLVLMHLQTAAEMSWRWQDSERALLLRRQVYFLASIFASSEMEAWLSHMAVREERHLHGLSSWSPSWPMARSLTVARARLGDPEPLQWFIDTALRSDQGQLSDFNYWAYWVGEIPDTHHSDSFMVNRSTNWHGATLLRRLCDNFAPGHPTVDIYLHSIWALLRDRPYLLRGDRLLASDLYSRTAGLLEHPIVSVRSRKKLESLYYGLRFLQHPADQLNGE